ncbi:C-type mannose receptor 2-like isoform X1 [Kryptolebias marmoratus]|uniref:C-type mannose receptor 2-like n=1 Tax=Kryptolebias marmoratus TaxID=37003 RepID=A0A3Q2ZB23_KRYMA|nr:C-type mannose receptor 2-like isoform X1 [Kryptolebias marmoratus]
MQWSLILLFLMGQCCFITCLYEYHYVGENKNWSEAQQYCREKYTDLATVSNMTDMKRIPNKSGANMNEAWIGLYDQTDGNRTWHWSLPGVEFSKSKTNWSQGEPDDVNTENCGMIKKYLAWGDLSCGNDKQFPFLCYDEKNTTQKFHLINDKMSWLKAQNYCREHHTDLISGLNQLQDKQLQDELSSVDDSFIYIGLFRDTWRWSDGSSFSFRHWNLQFNNTKYNSGQCAMTVFDDGGRWKNGNCTDRKPFICYDDKVILIKENKTWEEALYYCRDHYHDLVTITDLDEQRWVQEEVKKASTLFVWMGLRYTCTLDLWFWISDEVVSYKNWVSDGQMDDCDMSGAMETGGQHKWFKKNDTEELNFICSK